MCWCFIHYSMNICSAVLELLCFHRRMDRRKHGWAIRWATNHARNHDEERRTGTSASVYETSYWITTRIYNLPNIPDTIRLYTTTYHRKLNNLYVAGVQGSHHQTVCCRNVNTNSITSKRKSLRNHGEYYAESIFQQKRYPYG